MANLGFYVAMTLISLFTLISSFGLIVSTPAPNPLLIYAFFLSCFTLYALFRGGSGVFA